MSGLPRVVFAGRAAHDLPLSASQARKWDALAAVLDVVVLGVAGRVAAPDPRFRLRRMRGPLVGPRAYAGLIRAARDQVRAGRVDAFVAQSPYEGAMLLAGRERRPPAPVIVEVHGDWRTASRHYGPRARRAIAPAADRVALAALRRAHAIRAVGPRSAELVREAVGRDPDAVFPTFFDSEAFLAEPVRPPGADPIVVWVGVLERYKNPAVLARAWPLVQERLPAAQLVVIGRGRETAPVKELVARFPGRVRHEPWLEPPEVARALDDAWALVLPSRSEGLPRVAMEAFLRGRPVVGTDVDGITDLVRDGITGRVVPDDDARALAAALVDVLSDREAAERMGSAGRAAIEADHAGGADAYAGRVRSMVDAAVASFVP